MRKIITIALIALALFSLVLIGFSEPILAGGDKVRGDGGQGSVVQNGETPFGDPSETPAGPNY